MHNFQQILLFIIIPLTPTVGILANQLPEPDLSVPVSLNSAIDYAVRSDPRIQLLYESAEASEGQIEQAALRPNPVVGVEIENFLGTGPVSGIDGYEITLGISQLIETADKRGKRSLLARRERELVDWKREELLAEIETKVRTSFLRVLLAQESVSLHKEQLALAERSEAETKRMVESARSPTVELSRARLAIRQQNFALDQARRELASSKKNLGVLWGLDSIPDFQVDGKVVLDPSLPRLPSLIEMLSDTAYLAQFETVSKIREAVVQLEKARAKPDFEVFAGGRYFNETGGDMGFVAGLEIPWPLSNKNQGNIRTARAQARAVEFQRETARRDLLVRLGKAYQTLSNAHAEAMSVQNDLLNAAQETLADTQAGYESGQFTLLAVLESRQTLFNVRGYYLDALNRYAEAKAEIEALTRPAQKK